MLKVFLIVGVLLGALFVGGKFYLHARVADAVDGGLAGFESMAEISYSGVTSSLGGVIGIENLHIKPHGVADAVRIDSLTLEFPDFGYVLQLEDNIKTQNYPESLFIAIKNLSLSTQGALVRTLDEAAAAQMVASDIGTSCVSRSSKMVSELAALGYESLSVDYKAGYQHDPIKGEFSMSGKVKQHDALAMDYEIVVPLATLTDVGAGMFFADPALIRGSVNIRDDGYYSQMQTHCSALESKDRKVIVAEMMSVWSEQMSAMGIPPDSQMLEDYQRFLSTGETFTINAIPHEPVKLQYLALYEPKDIPNLLNIATASN